MPEPLYNDFWDTLYKRQRIFKYILIELRDINGEFLEFSPSFKTIITLKIRSSSLYKESN